MNHWQLTNLQLRIEHSRLDKANLHRTIDQAGRERLRDLEREVVNRGGLQAIETE